jgi:hypothetical protein
MNLIFGLSLLLNSCLELLNLEFKISNCTLLLLSEFLTFSEQLLVIFDMIIAFHSLLIEGYDSTKLLLQLSNTLLELWHVTLKQS